MSVSIQSTRSKSTWMRRNSAERKRTSHSAACATTMAPSRRSRTSRATLSKRGAPETLAASIPCTCAAPPTRSPGSRSVEMSPVRSPPTTRSRQISTTRSRVASSPVISRSTKTSGACETGRSQGGPGGGSTRDSLLSRVETKGQVSRELCKEACPAPRKAVLSRVPGVVRRRHPTDLPVRASCDRGRGLGARSSLHPHSPPPARSDRSGHRADLRRRRRGGPRSRHVRVILLIVTVPPHRPSPLAPGFKLDRYELLCPIAEGGMASVWIARQTGKHGFEKLVAVKTILPKFAADARFQKMFVDEARIASRIEHANVAQILDVGEQHGTTYLVMEYVDGDSLSTVNRSLQKKGIKLSPGVLLRLMSEVCGGLHAAHELRNADGPLLGVVHRDVSPQNVLVSTRGITKLIDFGIAKARDRGAGDTNTETLKGKVRYMAPEQAHGHNVDRRADLWAVGAIMYHFLAGKPPYDGENDVQTLLLLTSGRAPPPLPSTVHGAIASVVNRALATLPDQRYATATEMQQALQEAMAEAKASSSAAAVASFLGEHVAEPSR